MHLSSSTLPQSGGGSPTPLVSRTAPIFQRQQVAPPFRDGLHEVFGRTGRSLEVVRPVLVRAGGLAALAKEPPHETQPPQSAQERGAFARRPTYRPSLRCGSAPLPSAKPVGEIGRRQLVQAHALRCGACRQPLVPLQVLGTGNAPLSCSSAAAHALKASCASAMAASTVSPSATQPGRSGTATRKPPPSSGGRGSMWIA